MPDSRRHRGPHPHDAEQFAPETTPALRSAVDDVSWLWSRGYAEASSLKLVGDRYRLAERQRTAVMRCSCSDAALERRRATRIEPVQLAEATVAIDGFNLLTTIEAALAGGVIIVGRDDCFRDMASMHGSWRRVAETRPAAEMAGRFFQAHGVSACHWLLDAPVSNSGRLAQLLRAIAAASEWRWTVETVPSPDSLLRHTADVVVSADSAILDACGRWANAAREIVTQSIPAATLIDVSENGSFSRQPPA